MGYSTRRRYGVGKELVMASVMDHQGLVRYVVDQRSIPIKRGEPVRGTPQGLDVNEEERREGDKAAAAALVQLRMMLKQDPVLCARVALKVCEEEELNPERFRLHVQSDAVLVEILTVGWRHTEDEALEHQLIKYITQRSHTNTDCSEAKAMRLALEGDSVSLPKLLRSIQNVRSDENTVVKVLAHAAIRKMSVKEIVERFA